MFQTIKTIPHIMVHDHLGKHKGLIIYFEQFKNQQMISAGYYCFVSLNRYCDKLNPKIDHKLIYQHFKTSRQPPYITYTSQLTDSTFFLGNVLGFELHDAYNYNSAYILTRNLEQRLTTFEENYLKEDDSI